MRSNYISALAGASALLVVAPVLLLTIALAGSIWPLIPVLLAASPCAILGAGAKKDVVK